MKIKRKKILENIKKRQEGTHIRNSLFFSLKTRLHCQPTLVTTIECVSSMITSVIVPIGHGKEGGGRARKRRVERSYDEAKQRKKNELREDHTITTTQ